MDLVRPRYQWFRHCVALAEVLQRVADGEIKRLMIFMPPRHGKSEEVSRLFTAYFLYRFPHRWVGICSYAAELAYTLSRAARENYTRAGCELASSAAAVKHWQTKEGGGLWAAGVGGPITGKGWHLGIIDDPLKNAEQAASDQIRTKQKEWYESTFYTREEPNDAGDPDGALVVIQTRWNEADLAGMLLAEEGDEQSERWHIVNFEAIKEPAPPVFPATCTVEPDWRQVGEALCPERRPLEKLRRIARRIGSYFWAALFQQRPAPSEGAIFKAGWFDTYRRIPPLTEVWTCWDTAMKAEEQNDETACVTVGTGEDGFVYVLRVAHGRWETPDVAKFLVAQARWFREKYEDAYRGDYVEDKVSGTTLMQYLRRTDRDVVLIGIQVEGDKVSRAQGVAPVCESRRVLLPDLSVFPQAREWVHALLTDLVTFPNGSRKDIVDAFVYALKRHLGTLGSRKSKRSKRGGVV